MEKKEAILAKKEEFAEFREELKDMNLSEAKEAIKDMHKISRNGLKIMIWNIGHQHQRSR